MISRAPVRRVLWVTVLFCASRMVVAQTHTTVRHHRVAESTATTVKPEVTQAEDALDHKNYASAEQLLKKVTAEDAKACISSPLKSSGSS